MADWNRQNVTTANPYQNPYENQTEIDTSAPPTTPEKTSMEATFESVYRRDIVDKLYNDPSSLSEEEINDIRSKFPGLYEKWSGYNQAMQQYNSAKEVTDKQKEEDTTTEAAREQAAQQEAEAQEAATKAAQAEGANKAMSSAIGGASSTNNTAQNVSAMKSTKASTQNDWLEKQGYANSLAQQAANQRIGSNINIGAGILQGASSGMQLANSMGVGGR